MDDISFQKSPFHRRCTHNHQHIISSLSAVLPFIHPQIEKTQIFISNPAEKKSLLNSPMKKEKKNPGKKCEIKKA